MHQNEDTPPTSWQTLFFHSACALTVGVQLHGKAAVGTMKAGLHVYRNC